MKKVFTILFSIVLVLLVTCSMTFAAENTSNTQSNITNKADASMTLVEDNTCHITFGKYGEFEKKLIQINTEEKTIDIGLTIKNNAEILENKKADVVLLIDASESMNQNTINIGGEEISRKQAVLNSAQTLVDKLFAVNPEIRIGIVEFATSTETNDQGYTIEGTDKDAKIITSALTSDKDTIANALNTVSKDVMGPRTNIEVGLDAAYSLLETSNDSDVEKYIITLTDAIPNTARGVTMDTYSDATIVPTRNKVLELKENDVNLISMLIEMSDDEIEISKEDPKPTYREVAERIFGSSTNPTAGSVYYVSDDEVEDTITNQIYDNLVQESYDLTDIAIKDYFPQNIIDNFNYAQLTESNIGTVTAEVNKDDNSITWTIPSLAPGEVATFSYRLSLKDQFSSDIVGINLPTNENVEITYEENGTPGEAENDDSPIVALDVLPKDPIPQTGIYTGLAIIGTVAILGVIGIGSYSYIKKNRF